jgi:cytochrome c-type biogenesis protein CcmH
MTLWFVFALMTAAAIFAVLWPLSRRGSDRGGSDIAVYRDQLDEITRDRSAGLIGEAEAEAAKVEVSRRLLAAADAADAEKFTSDVPPVWRRSAAIAGLVLLPVGAITLYLALGSPQMPGQPLSARVAAQQENRAVETMIAQVEEHVARNPNDGRAWEVLGPVYMRLSRFDDAVKALRNSLRLNGSNAAREADLGEALVFASNGVITPEAKTQFDHALALDGQDVMARFYLGMAADQAGRRAEAEAAWRDLLANAPPGAPWVEMVRHALERTAPAGAALATTGAPGPNAAASADTAKLPPDHDAATIASMVARLADRLKKDGSDADGWVQLVRSYRALGQGDQAQAAAVDARRALAGDPDKLRRFAEGTEAAAVPAAPAAPVAPAAPAAAPAAPTAGAPGPSAADIAAAAEMKPDQQNQMIVGMVMRLADRLKQNGDDVDGWLRLVRAYSVLGERDKAQAAAADARRALAGDSDKVRRIDQLVKELGLPG